MDIKFRSIDINSFRSIEKAHIELGNQGTVVVKGINEYEDKATSNGSGKSSIFEAIVFVLYEETSSGEKDVSNRVLGRGYVITLSLELDGIEYLITREEKSGKSFVSFYKNGMDISARTKTETNKLIQECIGIDKNIFLDSVVLSQNASTNLASLSPTARKERLEILTSTDNTIAIFKEQVRQLQLSYESLCMDNQKNIDTINGQEIGLKQSRFNFEQKINEINEKIQERNKIGNMDEINVEIKNKNKNIDDINVQLENINKLINEYNEKIETMKLENKDKMNKLNDERDILEQLRTQYTSLESQIDNLGLEIYYKEEEIKKIEKQKEEIRNSDTCPTCGRKYDDANEEHIQQKINSLNKDIENMKNNIEETNKNINQLKLDMEIVKQNGTKQSEKVTQLENEYNDYQDKINDEDKNRQKLIDGIEKLRQENAQINEDIRKLNEQKERINNFVVDNKEEYEKMISDTDNTLQDLEENLKEETQTLNENNDKVIAIKHMIMMITKEFRTYLLQNSITYLNELLKGYSYALFSNEQDIIKLEGDGNKLDIKLGSANYESLSGGEKTRVNIALLLAQKSLASSIGNINCNIIILDEILGYCDGQAEISVMDLISKELERLESIFVVSHKEIPVGYDEELVVTKNKQGLSSVRCY